MKVLVIGSGGREDAITWKIAQSKCVDQIFCAPGNGGMAERAELVDIKVDNIEGLLSFAKENNIDLTIVGPEAPLVDGIVDKFSQAGLKIFGPSKELAKLEASKVFSKELMTKLGVPTASFKVFTDAKQAKEYVKTKKAPLVVKADGLCAGKGVIVCKSVDEALDAVTLMLDERKFGDAGQRIIVEDCLIGEEASIIVLSDGENVVPLASSQDHKAAYDGDKGPNTGGMGAYSPAPIVTEKLLKQIMDEVIYPIISGLKNEEKAYKGVLYAGLMMTESGPKVLEFNVRFGDPETQAIFPRLKDDLIELIEASINGGLKNKSLKWDKRPCVSVVVASGGYPGGYEKGKEITGLDETKKMKDVVVFHAGTTNDKERILTNGGRVLNVTALGKDIKNAIDNAYKAVGKINFDKIYYRKDIAYKALNRRSKATNEKDSCISNCGK